MTGRPGYWTMEMIGGSSAPYLARTPCVPLFCTSFNRVGNKERFRLPGAGGGSFPLYGGTFARSYSVSKFPNQSSCNKVESPNPRLLFVSMSEPVFHARTLKAGSRGGEAGVPDCAECPNLSMPERPRFPLHMPEWPKRLLFVSVSWTDFHQQEGTG